MNMMTCIVTIYYDLISYIEKTFIFENIFEIFLCDSGKMNAM